MPSVVKVFGFMAKVIKLKTAKILGAATVLSNTTTSTTPWWSHTITIFGLKIPVYIAIILGIVIVAGIAVLAHRSSSVEKVVKSY